jgi:hypothetical protein
MFDWDKAGTDFDFFMDHCGMPPFAMALFDRRVLFPRQMVPELVKNETNEVLTLAQIDELEGAGVFSWLHGAGDDGQELGVPMYVPYRIGLCVQLQKRGWMREEIRDFVEWEEWVVNDFLCDGELPYEDDDRQLVLTQYESRLRHLQDEQIWRLAEDKRPQGWSRSAWDSETAAFSDDALAARITSAQSTTNRIRSITLDQVSEKTRRAIQREAYQLRCHFEFVRFASVASDRNRAEAGFSPCVQVQGSHKLLARPTDLEGFGAVDWHGTLSSWRVLDDPDRYPVRLPGFICIGGRVTMEEPLLPDEYARRYQLFRLDDYVCSFRVMMGERRCQQCGKRLPREANERRLYCSERCSQAHRQKLYRRRTKSAILERRGQASR